MLRAKLQEQIVAAMKAGETAKVSTLRLLANALHNEEISKQRELTEEEEVAILKRQLKQREEAVEAYEKAGRTESAESEQAEAELIKAYLPSQMDQSQVEAIVEETIAELNPAGPGDFGRVMQAVMVKLKGQADGKVVSDAVRAKIQG
jgi:uncharacterized protein